MKFNIFKITCKKTDFCCVRKFNKILARSILFFSIKIGVSASNNPSETINLWFMICNTVASLRTSKVSLLVVMKVEFV